MNPTVILGGTFDPPHAGHTALLQAAGTALGIGDGVFLLAAAPWQKSAAKVTPAAQRLAMLELSVAALDTGDARIGAPRLRIDTRELERYARSQQPSYTIDSLREIRAEIGPDSPLVFVLGWDQWLRLPTWHNWRELLDVAHLCVAPRSEVNSTSATATSGFGMPSPELDEWTRYKFGSVHTLRQSACGAIYQLPEFDKAVSSSALRVALARGHTNDVDMWLEPAVLRYISEQQLYR
jgi:nicotinate-nucleotide adenylyltransferase